MAARLKPSKGPKPDKLIRDAVILELCREVDDPADAARKVKRLQLLARSIVNTAIAGDNMVIREVFDRVDGKQLTSGPGLFPAISDDPNSPRVGSIEVHFVTPDPRVIEHEPLNGKNGRG